MADLGTLRRLRVANSTLMQGNLALLMAIRETDSQIQDEWEQLQRLCEELEKKGTSLPASCLALMGDTAADSKVDPSYKDTSVDDGASNKFSDEDNSSKSHPHGSRDSRLTEASPTWPGGSNHNGQVSSDSEP